MKKQEKNFDLKTIMTQKSYNRLNNYLSKVDKFGDENADYGCDAFALLGSSANLNQVCQMFNVLADPEYINLRSDWGDITGKDNEVIPEIDDYATGVKNSFAIKKVSDNFGHLDFPLFNNYMSVDSSVADFPLQTPWTEQKKLLQNSLGITIVDNKEFDNFFEYAEKKGSEFVKFGKETGFKHTAAKVMHLPLKMLHKMFKVVKLEDKFPFKKQLEKDPNAKERVCFVSKHFKDHDLSNLDKFVAVVDALIYEKVAPLLNNKEVWKDIKGFDYQTRRKVLVASKLIADWAVCMASDLGKENHKQMDNALRLELNSVLGTLPQDDKNITTAIANVSNDLTSAMFKDMKHLNYASIVEHRKQMGVEYVDDFDLGRFATWEIMKENNPNALKLHHVLFGRTINKSFEKTKDNISFKGYSPAFNNLQPEAEVVEEYQPTPIPQEPISVTPPISEPTQTSATNSQQTQDDDVKQVAPSQAENQENEVQDAEEDVFEPAEEDVFEPVEENTEEDVFEPVEENIEEDVFEPVEEQKTQNPQKTFDDFRDEEVEENKAQTAQPAPKGKDRQTTLDEFNDEVIENKVQPEVENENSDKNEKTTSKVAPKSTPKPNFGPMMLGYVVPVDVEAEDVIVGTDYFGTPTIAILDKDRKLDKNGNPKFEICNSLLEENGTLRIVKYDNTFEPVISGEISIDEDLRVWRTLENGKEDVVGYLIRPNELENFKKEVEKAIKRHQLEQEKERIRNAQQRRKVQVAKNEEQRKAVEDNLKIAKYLDKKTTAIKAPNYSNKNLREASSQLNMANAKIAKRNEQVKKNKQETVIDEKNIGLAKLLDNALADDPYTNKGLSGIKYLDKKTTAIKAPNYSNKNLRDASSQLNMANAKIAKRNEQVAKNQQETDIDEKNIALAKLLDNALADDPYTNKGLSGIKYLEKNPTAMKAPNYSNKTLNKASSQLNMANEKIAKRNEQVEKNKQETVIDEKNIGLAKLLDSALADDPYTNKGLSGIKYLEKNPTGMAGSNIQEKDMKKMKYMDKKPTAMPNSNIQDENLELAKSLKTNEKKKGVCPKYDKERLYQLYANGVLPELDEKTTQAKADNGIIIQEDVKKHKTQKQTSQQEQNPQLFKESIAEKEQVEKPSLEEMNPELKTTSVPKKAPKKPSRREMNPELFR